MTQLSLLDHAAGQQLRDAGVAKVTASNAEFVNRMRQVARQVSYARGWCHIDDCRRGADELGIAPSSSNAWGAIFAGKGWQRVGAKASDIPSNHRHVSPCWKWVGGSF